MYEIKNDNIALRQVFKNTLAELMDADKNVTYLEADLAGAIGTTELFGKYPEQAFNMGIMEANMAGVGAGMSLKGKIPFIHSFGTFTSRRCADQVFLSACYNDANLKITGSDPGITAEANGGTHMPFEDVNIYRAYPNMTILDVADPLLLHEIMKQMAAEYGVMYLRFPRKWTGSYYKEGQKFQIGKGVILRDGTDATIIASGIEVQEALLAAEELEKEGIQVRVADCFTIKPIDRELIIRCARETGAVVTAENHNIIGGLGSAVAEILVENAPVPMKRIGVGDQSGEVGSRAYLAEKFGLTKTDIKEAVKTVISRK
jgi:transketolase